MPKRLTGFSDSRKGVKKVGSNLSGCCLPPGNEPFPDGNPSPQFELPKGEIVPCFPPGVIPPICWELAHNDPNAVSIDLVAIFAGEGQPADSGDSSPFELPVGEMVPYFPSGTIPSMHWELAHGDLNATPIDLDKLFSKDLELTDAKGGIRSQKANRNIKEMANAIARRNTLAVVENRVLCLYKAPYWRILDRNEATRFVVYAAKQLFGDNAAYLSKTQYGEIVFDLLNNEATENLSMIPAPDCNYLCCRDSLYDWHSGECIPHDSSYMRFSFLDVDTKEIGSCTGEHWELFLDNLTRGDDDLRQRILEMIGVILSGYPSKSFFWLEGESGTGKSQLANFLRDVLGNSSCFALNEVDQLSDKWTTGHLPGKLLCTCGDAPKKPLSSKTISTIKELTGDDPIRGELKYQEPFTFENTAKLLFASNFPLQISKEDQDEALMKRLVVIPCRNPVPQENQIPGLHRHLHQEAGYIIGLAMDALIQFEERNGAYTPLSPDYECEAVQMLGAEQEVTGFVQAYCMLDENATCTTAELFEAFQDSIFGGTLNKSQFSKTLCSLFPEIQHSRTNTTRFLKGISLKPADTQSVNPGP